MTIATSFYHQIIVSCEMHCFNPCIVLCVSVCVYLFFGFLMCSFAKVRNFYLIFTIVNTCKTITNYCQKNIMHIKHIHQIHQILHSQIIKSPCQIWYLEEMIQHISICSHVEQRISHNLFELTCYMV
jgi:hypothetical protein